MDTLQIFTQGLPQLAKFISGLPGNVNRNAVRAVNRGAELTRTDIAGEIGSEINFKPRYLAPSGERLYVKERATGATMAATIFGRDRPTSLAQFISGSSPAVGAKGGVTIQVKRGVSKFLPNAFIMKLKSGTLLDDENFNLGLAVRLAPGEKLLNKTQAIAMRNGLYLLYGPSVGQAMRMILKEGSSTLTRAANVTEAEFDRLMSTL
jgi:hypothetical protein